MKRVVQSTPLWLPVTHSWLFNNLKHVDPVRIENHVLCFATENLETFSVPNIHSLGGDRKGLTIRLVDGALRRLLGMRVPQAFSRQAQIIKPDLWHSHTANWCWQNLRIARWCAQAHILSVYGRDISVVSRSTARVRRQISEVLSSVDHILCEGPAMKAKLLALGCAESKVVIHRLGVDVDLFPYSPLAFDSPDSPLRILLVGRFVEKKGFPVGLSALAGIASEIPVEVTIIGDAYDTRDGRVQRRHVLSLIANLRDKCLVRFLGMQPYAVFIRELYQNHVYLAPSITAADGDDEGGSPVAMTEAGAAGMLLVGSRHCDIPELVRDRETGFLTEERSVRDIQNALRHIHRERHALDPVRDRCRRLIEQEYNAVIQCGKLSDFYATLPTGRRTDV